MWIHFAQPCARLTLLLESSLHTFSAHIVRLLSAAAQVHCCSCRHHTAGRGSTASTGVCRSARRRLNLACTAARPMQSLRIQHSRQLTLINQALDTGRHSSGNSLCFCGCHHLHPRPPSSCCLQDPHLLCCCLCLPPAVPAAAKGHHISSCHSTHCYLDMCFAHAGPAGSPALLTISCWLADLCHRHMRCQSLVYSSQINLNAWQCQSFLHTQEVSTQATAATTASSVAQRSQCNLPASQGRLSSLTVQPVFLASWLPTALPTDVHVSWCCCLLLVGLLPYPSPQSPQSSEDVT